MVPAEGFEPPTTRLRSGCSTAELRRLKTAPLISVQPTIGKQYSLCRLISGTACADAASHCPRVTPTLRALDHRRDPGPGRGHPVRERAGSRAGPAFAWPLALIVRLWVEESQTPYPAWFPASGASPPRRREARLRSLASHRPATPRELSIQIHRAFRLAPPAASAPTPRHPLSKPDRRTHASPAPSIRGRVLDHPGPLPRFPPSAWRRGASAPRHMARGRRAPLQIGAHRAPHVLPPAPLRAAPVLSRQVFAYASAAHVRCRRVEHLHNIQRCQGAD